MGIVSGRGRGTLHPWVPGAIGTAGNSRGTRAAGEPTSAMGERGKKGQPALPKQKMGTCPPQMPRVQVCADGVCAHGSVGTWVTVGSELFLIGPR